jgi:hypothetical protein
MGRSGDWGRGARGTERRVKPRERRGVGVVRGGVVGMVRGVVVAARGRWPWLPVLRGGCRDSRSRAVRNRSDDDNISLF